MSEELPGMLAVAKGVAEQTFPHTMDAQVWAREFNETLAAKGIQPLDPDWMISWFANAIMAGYDTAQSRHASEKKSRGTEALAWAVATFGEVAEDKQERAMRFIEEAIELVNAIGLPSWTVEAILHRIYQRQKGDRSRELGQAMLTLELLAEVCAIDPQRAAAFEFERVQAIPKEEWDRRHKAKVDLGIAKPTVFLCKLDKSACDHDWTHGDGRMDDTCKKCGQLFGTYIHMEAP